MNQAFTYLLLPAQGLPAYGLGDPKASGSASYREANGGFETQANASAAEVTNLRCRKDG
jgi:hypothetical protein